MAAPIPAFVCIAARVALCLSILKLRVQNVHLGSIRTRPAVPAAASAREITIATLPELELSDATTPEPRKTPNVWVAAILDSSQQDLHGSGFVILCANAGKATARLRVENASLSKTRKAAGH